ncbi:hypothetical protein ABT288_40175 [Streptomyces sp. NPDC001093]|uniref:hypothetical protein n=1 Tax=Streptomyces sp. NPDC001093 TaxID=3154376 RepID=UPI003323DEF2
MSRLPMELTSWDNALMRPLPVPCPADLILDATGMDAYNAAYRAAKQQRAMFIAIECQAEHWTVNGYAPQTSVRWFALCCRLADGSAQFVVACGLDVPVTSAS